MQVLLSKLSEMVALNEVYNKKFVLLAAEISNLMCSSGKAPKRKYADVVCKYLREEIDGDEFTLKGFEAWLKETGESDHKQAATQINRMIPGHIVRLSRGQYKYVQPIDKISTQANTPDIADLISVCWIQLKDKSNGLTIEELRQAAKDDKLKVTTADIKHVLEQMRKAGTAEIVKSGAYTFKL